MVPLLERHPLCSSDAFQQEPGTPGPARGPGVPWMSPWSRSIWWSVHRLVIGTQVLPTPSLKHCVGHPG